VIFEATCLVAHYVTWKNELYNEQEWAWKKRPSLVIKDYPGIFPEETRNNEKFIQGTRFLVEV